MEKIRETHSAYKLYGRLWTVIEEETTRYSVKVDSSCAARMQDLIAKGVNTIAPGPNERLTPELQSRLDQAEIDLRIMTLAMIMRAKQLHRNRLSASLYEETKKIICKIFPFPFCDDE